MKKLYYSKIKILNNLLRYKEIKNSLRISELKNLRIKIKNKELTLKEIDTYIKKFNEIMRGKKWS